MAMFNPLVYLLVPPLVVAAGVVQNITITVPGGTSNHGDPHLLCTPTRHIDLVTFFLANYVAHATTVRTLPGQSTISTVVDMLFALAFPVSGVIRGLEGIYQGVYQRIKPAQNPYEAALRAGALCEVARTAHWKPQDGEQIQMQIVHNMACATAPRSTRTRQEGQRYDLVIADIPEPASSQFVIHQDPFFSPDDRWYSITGRKVHGICKLPPGYTLSTVPPDAQIQEQLKGIASEYPPLFEALYMPGRQGVSTHDLSSNYSFSKALVAILQLVYGSYTLYRTRGDQVARYGYAAFGLTVAPYVIMSFINLLSAVLAPQYPCLYMVSSDIMTEAKGRGGKFEGVVGEPDSPNDDPPASPPVKDPPASSPNNDLEHGAVLTPAVFMASFTVLGPADSPTFEFQTKTNISQTFGDPEPSGRYALRLARDPSEGLQFRDLLVATYRWACTFVWPPRSGQSQRQSMTELRESSSPGGQGAIGAAFISAFLSLRAFLQGAAAGVTEHNVQIPRVARAHHEGRGTGRFLTIFLTCASLLIGLTSLSIVGGISQFDPGNSTVTQRAWTMSWLATGIAIGPISYYLETITSLLYRNPETNFLAKFGFLLYAAPAVGASSSSRR